MLEITVPLVCELDKLCLKEGEQFNILDKNRLESAIGNQWAPYPTDEQVIASVYRSLIQNHPFENGNKRTAVLAMLKMAESIDKKISLSHEELIDLTYTLAKEGGSQISTTSIANKLFGLDLEESKQYKYFAISDNASEYYKTLKDMKKDLHTFGDDEVRCYTLKYVDNAQELTDEDLLFIYKEGKIIKENINEARQQTALKSNGVYSVLKDEWIKEPVAEDIPELDKEAFTKMFSEWEDRYLFIIKNESLPSLDDKIIESQSEKLLYEYDGPIYRFKRFVKNTHLDTMAVSYKQAINNLKFKAAKEIGYNRADGANVEIRTELVHLVTDYDPIEEIGETEDITQELCPTCGKYHLNMFGECPHCDLHDDSTLDESLDTSLQYRIEEIEEFIEDIYDLRKESIKNDGEYGIGNLVFKEMRNKGYLDNLRDLKNKLKSKLLSLE